MRKPIYGHLTHNLQKEKLYIKSFSYNIVANNLYTKFVKKKKELKKNIYIGDFFFIYCFCLHMFIHVLFLF